MNYFGKRTKMMDEDKILCSLQFALENRLEMFLSYTKSYPNISHIKANSPKDAWVFDDIENIDLLFIDSNHDYDTIMSNLKYWKNKVKFDGIICGHDYHFSGEKQAVDEFAKKNNYFLETNVFNSNFWIMQK